MSWAGDVAAELDRLVVAIYEATSAALAPSWPFPNAHPAVLHGIGSALLVGPVTVGGLHATYPYLPASMFEALVRNNVDEGVITLDGDVIGLTDAGRAQAQRTLGQFHDTVTAMWQRRDLSGLERATAVAVAYAATRPTLAEPSAFAVQAPLTDQIELAPRLFRQLNALRYWRADAHRASWANAGLTVGEAHALNRLWGADRQVERVGQGDPRPGRTGVAALTARGLAADDQITDAGRTLREAIEAETDTGTAIAFESLDDATRVFVVRRLREIPIH